MAEQYETPLHGCTPEPLMSYLKALGILRLVSEDHEHGDPAARGAWRDGIFTLRCTLDDHALAEFFLKHYQPTPIVAPWNGGCGFYKKWDPEKQAFKNRESVEYVERIANSTHLRLEPYRRQIFAAKQALAHLAKPVDVDAEIRGKSRDERKKILDAMLLFEVNGEAMNLGKAEKDDFLAAVRSTVVGEDALLWLDAAMVLLTGEKKNRTEAPLLGSGGNVGNSDFSAMFLQTLAEILPLAVDQSPPEQSAAFLSAALFGSPTADLRHFSIGQFDPGLAGGANATQGMEGKPILNPWNYVLMLEGSLLLGGAVTRRLRASRATGVFPFVVRSSSVGYGSAGGGNTRGEMWLPLWPQFATTAEIGSLLSEGRAEIGARRATTGVTFARAVASLGVDRGVDSFVRYEFQERLGQSYLATPLGRFQVRAQPDADLLKEADPWLDRFRMLAGADNSPPRFAGAMRRIDRSIFDFCRYGGATGFADILCSLGAAERELALLAGKSSGDKDLPRIPPISRLSPNWIRAACDGSSEFELALSLAGLHDRGPKPKIESLRSNLESVVAFNGRWDWADKNRAVVWNSADLSANMAAVLVRRVMDGARAGCEDLPVAPNRTASLTAISLFLAGQVDDRRIEELLWGLVAIDHRKKYPDLPRYAAAPVPLPRVYALVKLLFLHRPTLLRTGRAGETVAEFARNHTDGIRILHEPELIPLLRAGRLQEACSLAMRRLRSSGLVPMPHRRSGGNPRDDDWDDQLGIDGLRLAAALLFPIDSHTLTQLIRLVTRPSAEMTAANP
ncbi:MAG: type I-G CRISPR-associated protein Cas8g1/Csx17 [Acidobacteriota bacterium]